ncbi:MAG TPA: alpha/beta hydrolase-fold protein [Gemmataceae bacterium]|jgi:S-formylglutathione hydrolase FrmB|nr:alpha/beta hydrolase-fold protein [Gemmataceae bacterium]
MSRLIPIALITMLCSFATAAEPIRISDAKKDPEGWLTHEVRSPYQGGTTEIRVLLPTDAKPEEKLPVVYVLPVEAGRENRYGDGLAEVKKNNLANQLRAVFVAPTFSHFPWYADHPTKPDIRQETYFLQVVVPYIEKTYPVLAAPAGRLLLGFSKSGWGAYSLLLRHPDVFGKAAAWDAPLMMDKPGPYGSGDIFGTPENFERYRISRLLEAKAEQLQKGQRLILLGYGNFQKDHERAAAMLERLRISHVTRFSKPMKHDWHSGWVADGVWLLLRGAGPIEQEPNTWVKRSPLPGGPVSPGLGYEAALAYDLRAGRVIRWGGHNQGGGGEQNAETWIFDPLTTKWELKEPNTSPPGVCCAQQNVFDPIGGRYVRFSAFSGSHGWHWFRENYLSNTSVWTYDLPTNTWRDMRPTPAPRVSPLRCASWDSDHQVVVVFGGEGSHEGTHVYDPYTNTWTRMSPPKEPADRSGGNMAYDAAHKVHVLFGTQFGDDPHTWTYDVRKNEWRDMKPVTQPPTDRNDAVLAYDSNSRRVVAVVRAIDKADKDEVLQGHLETWAYDVGANTWTRMMPPREPDGQGNRRRILIAVPDQDVLLMEDYINPTERVPGVDREQQIWTYRVAALKADERPAPPTDLVAVTSSNGARLTWKPSSNAVRYVVYRAEGKLPWQTKFAKFAELSATEHRDESLLARTIYHYLVRAVDAKGRESEASAQVRTQPRVVEDVVATVVSTKEVRLSWAEPPGGGAVGYHVERAIVEVFSEDQLVRLKKDTQPLDEPSVGAIKVIGPFQQLTREAVKDRLFTDTAIDLGKPATVEAGPTFTHRFSKEQIDPAGKPYRFAVYAYRVRAVNALGVESGSGPYVLTIPRSPQQLFAKEDGERCHLKWTSNLETGVRYRVYRMEGPRINGPGQKVTRVTEGPIAATTFTDRNAGKDTRRYWVIAVDKLGQEGIPSAPAWHERQYRKLYEPFTVEWHQ